MVHIVGILRIGTTSSESQPTQRTQDVPGWTLRRRDTRAAKRLLRKLMKRQTRPPRVMVSDKLASYGAARREVMPSVEHRKHKGLNNRAENSHQPTRRRERQMKRLVVSHHVV